MDYLTLPLFPYQTITPILLWDKVRLTHHPFTLSDVLYAHNFPVDLLSISFTLSTSDLTLFLVKKKKSFDIVHRDVQELSKVLPI